MIQRKRISDKIQVTNSKEKKKKQWYHGALKLCPGTSDSASLPGHQT